MRIKREITPSLIGLFTLVFILLPVSARAQATFGAREMSMGQATTALAGSKWSLFSNPALSGLEQKSVSFFGIRYYGLEELTDMAVSVSYPIGFGVVSGGVYRYGFELFSEDRFRIGYANSSEKFRYGIAVSYNHVRQESPYGSFGAVGLDIGIAALVANNLWMGAKATNINQPQYGIYSNDISEDLPRDLSLGLSYKLSEILLFSSDIVKDVHFPISYRAGIEAVFLEDFKARFGITTAPQTFAAGFGYCSNTWEVNIAAQKHENPVLGISPGIDFSLIW